LMEIVGRAFLSKKRELAKDGKPTGNLISILRAENLPSLEKGKRKWQANEDNKIAEIVIRTHLPYSGNQGLDPLSRNHINALTSDLIVIFPGRRGYKNKTVNVYRGSMKLGFVWATLEADSEEGFSHLTQFKERKGHCRVPQIPKQ
jgi:hypothetical protein